MNYAKNALIIANGEACDFKLLKQLSENTLLTIVLDSAIERVSKLDIKVDIILGDFDRHFNPQKFQNSKNSIQIVHAPDQNKTDLEKAFEYLIEQKINSVNVLWATGRRADHTITNLTSMAKYRDFINITILDDYSNVILLPKYFEKYYEVNTIISLIPIGEVNGVCSENLQYQLKNDTLIMGYKSGSSNAVTKDGIVSISHTNGDLLLMECYD